LFFSEQRMRFTFSLPLNTASVRKALKARGIAAVLAQWPELEAHRSLLSQIQIEEQEREAYDRLSQVAAGRVERLLDLLKHEVAP
jgi:hypothetical protein